MDKKGLLIYNGFLKHKKYFDLVEQLTDAAIRQGVCIKAIGNDEILTSVDVNGITIITKDKDFDFVIFWDKDISLARNLESIKKRLFNTSKAIESCDDKMRTHNLLSGKDILMPKTISAPKSYISAGYTQSLFLDYVIDMLGFPLIVKENFGSFGQQVYKAENYNELNEIVTKLAGKPFMFQEFIKGSEGKDVRIHVVGGEVVASMYRYNENDFRANVTNGGKMKKYTPTKDQVDMAIKSCNELGLDFAGVDILFGEDEKPILCEINSNAHMKNILDCTGINVADCIMSYVKECMR